MRRTIAWHTSLLERAGRDPDTGQHRHATQGELIAIVEHDKRVNWPKLPRFQAEQAVLDCIPVQDGVKEAI